MSQAVARVSAIALSGIEGTPVLVEAALSSQLPGMSIIGLPDAALAEAKQRVRVALQQAGLALAERHIIVNLSPAALPKHGSGFDLSIALATAAASRHMPDVDMSGTAHVGELGLDGGLRRPPGLLSAVLAARRRGFSRAMVPASCAREALLVPDIDIIAAEDLGGAVNWYRDQSDVSRAGRTSGHGWRRGDRTELLSIEPTPSEDLAADMAEVIGQSSAVEALVVAAAGRHHLSMVGPPGAGKTLLATRLPGILPDLSPDQQIVSSSIASLSGSPLTELVTRPPFESPHHTATKTAIIGGGGGGTITPGAVTRAHNGVLFLDEAPQFARSVLDDLRQPLESGSINIQRARVQAILPASVQLVLAANPCPCGNAGEPSTAAACRCTPIVRTRYLSSLSGPLADRIDLRLTVRRVSSALLVESGVAVASSEELRTRVVCAKRSSEERLARTPWKVNAEVKGSWLRSRAMRLPPRDTAVLDTALARGLLTMRGYDRALRVSWTLADLAGKSRPGRDEVGRALALRGTAG